MSVRHDLKLEIRAFADKWCSECQPMQFRQEFRHLLREIMVTCRDREGLSNIAEVIEDALR